MGTFGPWFPTFFRYQGWTDAFGHVTLAEDGEGSDGPVIQGCGGYQTSHPTRAPPNTAPQPGDR